MDSHSEIITGSVKSSTLNQVREITNAKFIAQQYKNINLLNWAWTYEIEANLWNQFNCDECIIIEYRFQIFN